MNQPPRNPPSRGTPPVVYEVDAGDRITHVNAAWSEVADAVGAPGLGAPWVVGQSLWDFVSDATTRHLYTAVLQRVRAGAGPLAFRFRCDTPAQRRLMQMRIEGVGGGAVSFQVRLIAAQDRPPVALLETATPRSTGLIRMCSWCKRLPLPDGRWVEVEEAMQALDILDAPPLPAISHGMCPACHEALMDTLDRGPTPGDGEVSIGGLPPA